MATDILQALRAIVAQKRLRASVDEASLNKPFKELGLDSLDVFDVIVALEDKLGVKLPDDVMMGLKSVNDLVAALQKLLPAG